MITMKTDLFFQNLFRKIVKQKPNSITLRYIHLGTSGENFSQFPVKFVQLYNIGQVWQNMADLNLILI